MLTNKSSTQFAQLYLESALCYCIKTYYEHVKTLRDVDLWTECAGPIDVAFVKLGSERAKYETDHLKDMFVPCTICSDKPPGDASMPMARASLRISLDWNGRMTVAGIPALKGSMQSVVVASVLGNKGVSRGRLAPTKDAISATVIKPAIIEDDSTKRIRRAVVNGTDPSDPRLNDTVEIQVELHMVPTNVSMETLMTQMKDAIAGPDFATSLSRWRAVVLSADYSQIAGNSTNANATANQTTSSAGPTGSAGSAKASDASPRRSAGSTVLLATLLSAFLIVLSCC